MRARECVPAGIAGLRQTRDVSPRHFLHLIVNAACETCFGNFGERSFQIVFHDPRKAARRGLERGKLESGRPRFDHSRNFSNPIFFADSRMQCHINVTVTLHFVHLALEFFSRRNRLWIVIRHIDHDRNAPRRRRAGRSAQALLVQLTGGMSLAIDDAGNNPVAAAILYLRRGGRGAFANTLDGLAAHRDIAVGDDAIGCHNVSPYNQICFAHIDTSRAFF